MINALLSSLTKHLRDAFGGNQFGNTNESHISSLNPSNLPWLWENYQIAYLENVMIGLSFFFTFFLLYQNQSMYNGYSH